jgi:hypothetical protein
VACPHRRVCPNCPNRIAIHKQSQTVTLFCIHCVCTYVQRGSKNCFVVVLVGTLVRILHFRPISPCFQLLSILCHCMHACNLARQPCPATLPGSLAQQPCPAALPGSLARQPCPTDLPSSLARQPNTKYSSKYCIIVQFHHAFSILHHCMHPCPAAFPAALPGSLARQPCLAALPGSLARLTCPAALLGRLARQTCPAVLPGSLARQPCPPALQKSLQVVFRPLAGMHVVLHDLLGRQFSSSFPRN